MLGTRGARTRRAMFTALAVGFTACGKLHTGDGPEPATIIFVNQGVDEAAVYVVAQSGVTQRIGTVMAGRTDTLKIQPDLLMAGGSLNIVARLFSRSITPQTGPITVESGGSYRVTLGPDERVLSFLLAP